MSETASYRVLDREFLEARSRILQLAAILDRLERSPSAEPGDRRRHQLNAALECLGPKPPESGTRAEHVQLVFSRPYDSSWRSEFGI
jgi:hypothetical protein